jgi:hypothetical protein
MLRVAIAFAGFTFTVLGLGVALALDAEGFDDAGGWMLAAAGVGLCVVAVMGAPRHTGTIGQRIGAGKSAP